MLIPRETLVDVGPNIDKDWPRITPLPYGSACSKQGNKEEPEERDRELSVSAWLSKSHDPKVINKSQDLQEHVKSKTKITQTGISIKCCSVWLMFYGLYSQPSRVGHPQTSPFLPENRCLLFQCAAFEASFQVMA